MDKYKTAMNFWGRVEIAQKEAGIPTFKSLCENAGVIYHTIMNNRSQNRIPELESVVSIANELGTSIDWLIFGEKAAKYAGDDQVLNMISCNERLMKIARGLVSANKDQINTISYILGIEK